MGVRIKLKISSLKDSSSSEVNVLLNSGFETEKPEMVVPAQVAKELGFWPILPGNAVAETYEAAGGSELIMHYIPDAVEILAVTEDKASKPVKCALVISETEREVLLSDRTIDELDIIIESPGRGLWRFRDDVKTRNSVAPQYW